MAQDRSGSRGTFHQFPRPIGRMYATKTAPKGASDAGLVRRSALSEKGRPKIFLHWQAVKMTPGEFIRALHKTLRVVAMKAKRTFIRETSNAFKKPLSTKSIEKFHECVFPLTTHDIVHVRGIQRSIRVDRWEISSPNNGNLWMTAANLTGTFNRSNHLRTWHHGDTE